MKVDRTKAERSLSKKGFCKNKSGNHIFYHHEYNGQKTGVVTKVSHTKKLKDISGDLLLCMRKQLCLDTNMQVADLLNCSMGKGEFNTIMRRKGIF